MKHTFLFALLLALFLPHAMQAEIKRIQVSGENLTPVTFNSDTLYSRWIINSRLGSYANKSENYSPRLRGFGFASPYRITKAKADGWDYVPGLVARAVLVLGAAAYYFYGGFCTIAFTARSNAR